MRKEHRIKIIYEDKSIIVVDKPASLLTISDGKEQRKTLYHQVREYLHQKNQKCFIVHRLDKETSGIVLFAKSERVKELFQTNWEKIAINREYTALVSGTVTESGKIETYINEDKFHKCYIDFKNGKKCITEYEVLNSNKQYSLLKIKIKTGRKHQIRLSLKSINHPIVGDKKYGGVTSNIRRMCLHANRLEIINPITKTKMEFISNIPKSFYIN